MKKDKKLFQLQGFIVKSKETTDIYCIAHSANQAVSDCSSFATGLVVKKVYDLSHNW